uniref:Multidrug resistance efflux pump n=1 Tax=Desulfovibrio sp. U5L TaxID=596152 RepID=I2PWZ6_9BACT
MSGAAIQTTRIGKLLFLPRRFRKQLLGAALIGVAATATAYWFSQRWNHVTENDAHVLADMVTISSRVDGWIAARPVTDGDTITRGEELAKIDQREAALQVEELHAKLDSLHLQSERLTAQLDVTKDSTESDVAAAQARYEAAEANRNSIESELERNKLAFVRNKQLVDKDVISRQDWDVTRTTTDQVAGRLHQARAEIAEAKANQAAAVAKRGDVVVLKKQIEQLESDMAQVRAQLHQKEVELEDRVVRSPVDGLVDQKFVEPGEYVIPGQRLVLVHDPKGVWIEVHLKETKLADLRPRQPVDISVDAYPGRHFSGWVERIGNAATNQFALLPSPNPSGNFTKITQRVPVRIKVDQPADNPLRPGMMVVVDIDTSNS